MKKKLILILSLAVGSVSFAQFTTGTVSLTGSSRTLKIDTDATLVTMTLTGSSSAWLGVGFGGTTMSSVTDMFIWSSASNRDYVAPGGHFTPSPDAGSSQSWTILSDNVNAVDFTRTVVATRPLVSSGDYTFLNDATTIPIIFAEGSTSVLGYHSTNPHAAQGLTRTALGIEDFSLETASVYPNPSNGEFFITTKTGLNKVSIYSLTGTFIKTIQSSDNSNNMKIVLKNLQSGVYLIKLENGADKSWKKIVLN